MRSLSFPDDLLADERLGDLAQVRNQAVLAADPMASKQPMAWGVQLF
jgi:hypothetical protein